MKTTIKRRLNEMGLKALIFSDALLVDLSQLEETARSLRVCVAAYRCAPS